MQTISFPSTLTTIDDYAFAGCTSLTSVTLPDTLTSLGNYAFKDCTSLKSAKVNNGQKSITEGLFQGCTSLSSITLPDSIQYIRTYAFAGCTSLATVTLPVLVTNIYENAFLNSCIKSIQYTGTKSKWGTITITSSGNTDFLNATVTGADGNRFSANKNKWSTGTTNTVIKPSVSKVKSFKAKAGKKKLTLSWKKNSSIDGYQIQISTRKNFKGAKQKAVLNFQTQGSIHRL